MAGPINLNKARKARAKVAAKAAAAENRVRFGQPKSERQLAELKVAKAARELDGKKRDA